MKPKEEMQETARKPWSFTQLCHFMVSNDLGFILFMPKSIIENIFNHSKSANYHPGNFHDKSSKVPRIEQGYYNQDRGQKI
ncbi:MAG TPA: hypothetical protein VMW10_06230 [Alphaproteobacteria bacterium]|nr:hypothetical protein [Alphaproteobacteria bacterium]